MIKKWSWVLGISALVAGLFSPAQFLLKMSEWVKEDKQHQFRVNLDSAFAGLVLFALLVTISFLENARTKREALNQLREGLKSVDGAVDQQVPELSTKSYTDQTTKDLNDQWKTHRSNVIKDVQKNVSAVRLILDERGKDI